MQIIIDISEDVYTRLFDNGIQDNEIAVDDVCEIARAIRLGTTLSSKRMTPEVLDKIRVEIEDAAFDLQEIDGEHESLMVVDLNDALNIIDKHKP